MCIKRLIQKKAKPPYLFYDDFKTGNYETLMDFFISWTLRFSQKKYKKINKKVYIFSKKIVSLLLFNNEDELNKNEIISVKIGKQLNKIDLWAEIEIYGHKKKYVVVIENKVYNPLERDQLKKYSEYIKMFYKNVCIIILNLYFFVVMMKN